jgi:hypothetical protein
VYGSCLSLLLFIGLLCFPINSLCWLMHVRHSPRFHRCYSPGVISSNWGLVGEQSASLRSSFRCLCIQLVNLLYICASVHSYSSKNAREYILYVKIRRLRGLYNSLIPLDYSGCFYKRFKYIIFLAAGHCCLFQYIITASFHYLQSLISVYSTPWLMCRITNQLKSWVCFFSVFIKTWNVEIDSN